MQETAIIPCLYDFYCCLTFMFATDIQSSESDSFVISSTISDIESIHSLDVLYMTFIVILCF